MGVDYTTLNIATGRPGNPQTIIVTFRVDGIVQEVNKTAQLELILTTSNVPPGAVFQNTIEFFIQDSERKIMIPVYYVYI